MNESAITTSELLPENTEQMTVQESTADIPAGKGLANLRELDNLEVLRTELASSARSPKVILSYETISFNKACVNLMPDTRFVNVLISI